jgi:hypothetical protein
VKVTPLFLSVLPIPAFASLGLAQTAPPNTQNVRKEHLEYCVSQLTVQVAQLEAIEGVKKILISALSISSNRSERCFLLLKKSN